MDNGQKKFIKDCWHKFNGNAAVKLVRTHHFTEIPINDVWLVVKDIKPKKWAPMFQSKVTITLHSSDAVILFKGGKRGKQFIPGFGFAQQALMRSSRWG